MWYYNKIHFYIHTLLLILATNVVVAATMLESTTTTTATSPSQNINYTANVNDAQLSGKLVFAHVLFRHGDRMPVDPYPKDPWNDEKYWPTGWGQLTNTGKDQHYRLGQWLRQRYDSLLSRKYTKDEIFVRSTDVDRTLMSVLSNLAGLYPPEGEQVWNQNIEWQPIPVHTVPEYMDNVLAAKAPCPAYEYALSALQNSAEFQALDKRYDYLYKYLTLNTGRIVDTLQAVQFLNNTLYIENLYNKTLPEWTQKVYPSSDMTSISAFTFLINTYTRKMARLKTGLLIKEMLERFVDKAQGVLSPNRAVWIYSAHDTTVANVLNSLKVFDAHSPPYTACVLLEMRIDDKLKPYISIFYKNTTAEPVPLHIPGCGTACPLTQMFSLYKDILPENWERECKLSTMMMTYEEANIGTAMAILVTIITIMLFLSYIIMLYYRRRSYRDYFAYAQVA